MADKADGTVSLLAGHALRRLQRDEEFCLMVRNAAEKQGDQETADKMETLAADIVEIVEKHKS